MQQSESNEQATSPQHGIASGQKHKFRYHPAQYCEWGKETACPGEVLKMRVSLPDLPGEKESTIDVYERDADGNDDLLDEGIPVTLIDGVGTAEWTCRYVDDSDDIPEHEYIGELDAEEEGEVDDPEKSEWNSPEYYFKIKCDGQEGLSPVIPYRENLEMEVEDIDGEDIKNAECTLIFVDGTEIKGKIQNNILKAENIPPLSFTITVEGYDEIEPDLESEGTGDESGS